MTDLAPNDDLKAVLLANFDRFVSNIATFKRLILSEYNTLGDVYD